MWKPAIRAVRIEDTQQNGTHVLCHTYASFTLRVYTHLLPTDEDRTRRAIDAAFGHGPTDPDGLAGYRNPVAQLRKGDGVTWR